MKVSSYSIMSSTEVVVGIGGGIGAPAMFAVFGLPSLW
jgi:hypothetical protein